MDKDGLPLVIVLPPLPQKLRDALMPLVDASYPKLVKTYHSEEETEDLRGMASHCSYYNRMATRVCSNVLMGLRLSEFV